MFQLTRKLKQLLVTFILKTVNLKIRQTAVAFFETTIFTRKAQYKSMKKEVYCKLSRICYNFYPANGEHKSSFQRRYW